MNPFIKVLYLHNQTQISGGERSLLNLWENLDCEKFKPYLGVPEQGEFSRAAQRLGVEVFMLKIPSLSLWHGGAILKSLFDLGRYLRRHYIQIIHSYAPRNNVVSSCLGRILRVPVIWHERNLIFENERDVTRKLFFLPNKVICNSRAVAERFCVSGKIPKKVAVVLNGVNLDRFKPEQMDREDGSLKVVGLVSNLNARKRVEYFLEVAVDVVKEYQNVRFVIVGGEFPDVGGARLDQLKKMACQLGISEHTIFMGFREDVARCVGGFDVFAHVTIKEACSRAILEAMALGKPVVAINDGGNPELVEHEQTGFLVEAHDKENFVEAVVNLLKDDAKRLEMGQKGRVRVEELFNVKKNARATEQIYLSLIGLS